ncbi:protein wech-like [Mya arenaria]|uniref:protein wech-like n=1 Tax=Mya arenaria TaxID=6604 RepID=UPI0022E7D1D8|nr:protein wech-like [Mya arenaria]
MEVSGKIRDPGLGKCSVDTTVYCQPCDEGGFRAVARGFCQTCEEYMCDPCIEAHKRFKVSRNHIMLSKDKMPSFYPSSKKSDIGETEYCKTHPKEMIKFYCPTHCDLGCGDCVVLNHRSCEVDYIADVAQDFVIGNEFRELGPSIKRTEDLLSGSISNVDELLDEVENQSKHEIARLRKFRAEINTYLDRHEKELLDNIRKVEIDDENVLNALKSDCESAKSGLEAMRAELSSGDISVNQRYVAARRAEKDIRNTLDKKEQISGLIKARKYRFIQDEDTERLLGSNMGLGTLDVAGEFLPVLDLSTVTWKKGTDINVKTTQDLEICCITGSALLSSGILLLADGNNKNVKLVNVPARSVTSLLKLPVKPWEVCVLHDDQAAVTLPINSMIQLVSTKRGQLTRGKEIKVSYGCNGIASYNNRLYISYTSNPRIEVMTLDGHIISTFQTDDGRKLFKTPYNLTVSASIPPTLYVSDYTTYTVLQLSLDGKVLHEYRDKLLKYPTSLVEVGPGQLLVCGQSNQNVMLLTERGGKMREILGRKDGLTNPCSVSFCPNPCVIVVCVRSCHSLQVFNAN